MSFTSHFFFIVHTWKADSPNCSQYIIRWPLKINTDSIYSFLSLIIHNFSDEKLNNNILACVSTKIFYADDPDWDPWNWKMMIKYVTAVAIIWKPNNLIHTMQSEKQKSFSKVLLTECSIVPSRLKNPKAVNRTFLWSISIIKILIYDNTNFFSIIYNFLKRFIYDVNLPGFSIFDYCHTALTVYYKRIPFVLPKIKQ